MYTLCDVTLALQSPGSNCRKEDHELGVLKYMRMLTKPNKAKFKEARDGKDRVLHTTDRSDARMRD